MKRLTLLALIGLYGTTLSAQLKYPATPKIEVSDTLWGTVYKDNYRWLENMKDPKVISWFKQQAQLSDSVMRTISYRLVFKGLWSDEGKCRAGRFRRGTDQRKNTQRNGLPITPWVCQTSKTQNGNLARQ